MLFVESLDESLEESEAVEDGLIAVLDHLWFLSLLLGLGEMLAASFDKLLVDLQALGLILRLREKEEVAERAAALLLDVFVLALGAYLPHGVHALQGGKVGHLQDVTLGVLGQRALLGVDPGKECPEALVGVQVQVQAVHGLFIAHDLCEDLEPQLLVQEVESLSRACVLVLFCEEVEELSCLHLSHCFGHEYFEHFLNVLEGECNGSRVDNDEFYKVDEDPDVLLVGGAVLENVARDLYGVESN